MEAYPLYWPENWPRTNSIEFSRFQSTLGNARDGLIQEIQRLGGSEIILSTNIPLRKDGLPYASYKEPDDSGVAVYFQYGEQSMVFACDKYRRIWENMVAIRKTIEAIRGIERWGASDMMERAFKGFVALENKPEDWLSILEINQNDSIETAERNYRRLRSIHHPDKGGDAVMFNKINKAIETARFKL